MDDTNTSQNVESLIIDGYDTRKTTVPLGRHLSQSANVEDQKNFYKLKIQGCIFYNYCFFLLIIHPWMSTGGNMACTSIILAIGERLSRQRRDNSVPQTGVWTPGNYSGPLSNQIPVFGQTQCLVRPNSVFRRGSRHRAAKTCLFP